MSTDNSNGHTTTIPITHQPSTAKMVTIGQRFGSTSYENSCLRCGKAVWPTDKIGPLKDFTFFHKGCLKCRVCGSKLTLKTYFNNQQDNDDREVSKGQ